MARLIDITGKAVSGEWGFDDETGDGIPVIRTTNFTNDGVVNYNDIVTRKIIKKNLDEKYLRKGDIIIEKSGGSDKFPVGRVIYFDGEENTYLFNNFTGLLRVKNQELWYTKYVFYSLFFNYKRGGTRAFENKTTGLHNLKTDEYVRRYEVTERSRNEQILICEKLDRAYSIIKSRQLELLLLDELIKARFVELFGLPVSNTKGWKTEQMGEVAPAINYKGEFDDEVWLLNLDMVEAQTGRILDYLVVSEEEVGNSTCTFDTSNVLYSKLRPYLNKVVIPDRCGYATSELVPLQPVKTKINREYLAFMLRSDEFVNMINEKVAGAKMPRVPMGDFRKFDVPVPPMELQEQFADFVKQVDKSKVAVQKALDETQILFDSLMQKYFG